jgi:hypothetical protein
MTGLFYFFLIVSIVAGFWLVWVLVPKIDRRLNRRRIDRGIAKYLRETAANKSP